MATSFLVLLKYSKLFNVIDGNHPKESNKIMSYKESNKIFLYFLHIFSFVTSRFVNNNTKTYFVSVVSVSYMF